MMIEGLLVSSVEMESPPQEGRVMKIMRKKRTKRRKKRIAEPGLPAWLGRLVPGGNF